MSKILHGILRENVNNKDVPAPEIMPLLDRGFVTIYSYIMNKREKLLAKAQRAPGGLSFDEFEVLLKQNGWEFDRQKGSHRIWVSPNGGILPIQPDGKKAKGYQVRQALRLMEVKNG